MKLKVILTGATGMVGEGVLHECLSHPDVDRVLVISRKPCGLIHPKLEEIIHADFFNLTTIENQLSGFNVCFFCLGISSIGKKEDEYTTSTYMLTMYFARMVLKQNPGMIFCYISGTGTDSSEKGKMMWARVKGKTENDLIKLSFKNVYAFRPGYLHPTKGLKNTLRAYNYFSWLFPIVRLIFPGYVTTLKQLGLAMINVILYGYNEKVLEVKDIIELAQK